MSRKILLSFLSLIILVLAVNGCGKGNSQPESAKIEKVTNVEVFKIEATTFKEFLTLPVVVMPFKEVNVSLINGGKVTKIYVDKGDRVKFGQLLLETDIDNLKASLSLAKANLEYQKSDFDRNQQLSKSGSISPAIFDASTLALAQAQSSYDIAKKQLDESTLEAPFAGMITSRDAELGAILSPGAPAFRLIDIDRVKVKAGIPEKFIEDFKIGNTVSLKFDAMPDKEFTGKINYISPEASPDVRTFETEIVIENRGGAIKAGIMGNAQIEQHIFKDAVVIPLDALIETQEGRKVFVTKNDTTAEERSVSIGGENGTTILITSGLQPGDKVITKGQYDLSNGEKIKITGEYKTKPMEVSSK
jgi:membrane fusion protein, multidrug efflux system